MPRLGLSALTATSRWCPSRTGSGSEWGVQVPAVPAAQGITEVLLPFCSPSNCLFQIGGRKVLGRKPDHEGRRLCLAQRVLISMQNRPDPEASGFRHSTGSQLGLVELNS